MNDKQKFEKMMESFFKNTNPVGYELYDYYGAMIMKMKRNGKYQIRLQYDYKNRNMINGKPVEFLSAKAAMIAYEIIDKFSKKNEDNELQEDIESMLLA